MYLEFPEYQSYGGTLAEPIFIEYEKSAEAIINWYTFSRLKHDRHIPEEVKRLVYILIKLADLRNQTLTLGKPENDSGTVRNITHQANDGVSITYSGMSAVELFDTLKKECEQVIHEYLDGIMNEAGRKLLYRGLYPGE